MRIFPTAQESREISILKAIHIEVRSIETAILDRRDLGYRNAVINDTPMTISVPHWQAFMNIVPNRNLVEQQKDVIDYFKSLGYEIYQKTNSSTSNTFYWEVKW